jgi:hypothetical protein
MTYVKRCALKKIWLALYSIVGAEPHQNFNPKSMDRTLELLRYHPPRIFRLGTANTRPSMIATLAVRGLGGVAEPQRAASFWWSLSRTAMWLRLYS